MTETAAPTARKTLAERMLLVQAEVGTIEKKGRNTTQNYTYLKEGDLVRAIVELCEKHGLLVTFWNIPEKTEVKIVGETSNKKPIHAVTIELGYDVVCTDDAKESLRVLTGGNQLRTQGYSTDAGDKAIYKARTGAKKYALIETFLATSGDDPERDGAGDERRNPQQAQAPVTATPGQINALYAAVKDKMELAGFIKFIKRRSPLNLPSDATREDLAAGLRTLQGNVMSTLIEAARKLPMPGADERR